MKILFIANGIIGEDQDLAGGEMRFIEIAKTWVNSGHEIHLLSSQGGRKLCNSFNLDVIFHDFPCAKKASKFSYIVRALKSPFFSLQSLADFHEGIIYSTNNMVFDVIPALRIKLKKGRRVRWVSLVHMLPPFPPWKRKKSKILDSILHFINEIGSLWLVNLFADILLAVSQTTARKLKNIGINMKKVYPVECGVNYNKIRKIAGKVRNKRYDAVSVKRLQTVKGIFDLIEIWEIVVRTKPSAKLLLIGDGADRQEAKQMVIQKGLDRNIQFTGAIYDFEEKFKKVAESRLFLMPSYEENWGIVVGEAMAAGTPVIAYGLQELIDVWKDNIVLVPVGDKLSFAKKITDLIDNHTILNKISHKGIEFVKQYNWQDIAEKELRIVLGDKICSNQEM